MGRKKVCFNCRKAYSLGTDFTVKHSLSCPECGQQTTILQHNFRPPGSDDIKRWKVVEFLKDRGFIYQHIYKDITKKNGVVSYENYVDYPTTMNEAKDFVLIYKAQAYDLSKSTKPADT
jgi:DNA-directed RNA polymerase subunit RPC12/RpoP